MDVSRTGARHCFENRAPVANNNVGLGDLFGDRDGRLRVTNPMPFQTRARPGTLELLDSMAGSGKIITQQQNARRPVARQATGPELTSALGALTISRLYKVVTLAKNVRSRVRKLMAPAD